MTKKLLRFIQCSILLFIASLQITLSTPTLAEEERPKIGLVLAGGGARGGAHIGVLKVLEEHRIPVDYVAGTSFGAIVGALYASGYSAEDLDEALKNLDWARILSDSAPRTHQSFQRKRDDVNASIKFEVGYKDGKFILPNGLVRGNQLRLTLAELMAPGNHVSHFDQLPIPFRAIAADLLTGEQVVLEDGDLASAVLASMSVPGLFPPFERDNKLLVDGGIVNNLPIDIARGMGADIVIVVDISAPPAKREDLTSFTKVLRQMISLLTRKSREEQLATLSEQDILIKPDTAGVTLTDFTKTPETVQAGQQAAHEKAPQLSKLSLTEQDWQQYLIAKKPKYQVDTIEFVRINNESRLYDTFIAENIGQQPGTQLDQHALAEDLTFIYGTGDFESVDYRLVTENGKTGIEVNAKDRAVGNDSVQFGVSLEDDFTGTSNYNVTAIYTKRGINGLGAEWQTKATLGNNLRLDTQFYQPIDSRQRFFGLASAGLLRTTIGIVDNEGGELANVLIEAASAQLGGGINFSNWGRLTLGVQRTSGEFELLNNVPDFSGLSVTRGDTFDIQEFSFFTQFEIDTLDNAHFPRSGTRAIATYVDNRTFLGGDSTVNTLQASLLHARHWGSNTIVGWFSMGGAYGGIENPNDNFSIGGFRNLSGLKKEEISGRYMGILGLEYRRLLNRDGLTKMFGVPLYAGLTLETGNVWNRSEDIGFDNLLWGGSLFIGADTHFGPLYLGTGYTSGGNTSAFLFLGAQF